MTLPRFLNPAHLRTPAPLLALSAALLLGACGGDEPEATSPAPAAKNAYEAKAAETPPPLTLEVPSGLYRVDLNHADLSFRVKHLGLAEYVARFEDYSLELNLNAENIGQSTVTLEIDPMSVSTGYVGDYKATHEDSEFESWEEDLAKSPRFFHAGEHPSIRFDSTSVEPHGDHLLVRGDLTMRGETHPVVMHVYVTGQTASHPFTGAGAIGVRAKGDFQRSPFGIDFLVDKGLLGDEVKVAFYGELLQQPPGDDAGA